MLLRVENNFSSWRDELSGKKSIFKKVQINVIRSVLWSDGRRIEVNLVLPEMQQHCKNEIAEWFNVNRALRRIITIWCIIKNITKN